MTTINSLAAGLLKHREKIEQMKKDGTYVQPPKLNPIERAKKDPGSLRKAVTAMCFDCIGAGHDPDFRGSIRECPCSDCPLYPVRPYQKKPESAQIKS